jgi:hypothetical protein
LGIAQDGVVGLGQGVGEIAEHVTLAHLGQGELGDQRAVDLRHGAVSLPAVGEERADVLHDRRLVGVQRRLIGVPALQAMNGL